LDATAASEATVAKMREGVNQFRAYVPG